LSGPTPPDTDDDFDEAGAELRIVSLRPEEAGGRLDKTLADKLPELSRGRIQALLAGGRISLEGRPLASGSARAAAGEYRLAIPPPAPAEPQPETIPLSVLYEDGALIVIDKPAGMAMHPAPGSESGTLVNALLRHCGTSLSGIGGVARPGIVHRIDKDTSGLLVVAKTDAAHLGLAEQFAAHSIERAYRAICAGHPRPPDGTIRGAIARSSANRKKMAMVKEGRGKHAVTHYRTLQTLADATDLECTLETGRTHQVRVHLASMGHPLLGDPVYGRTPAAIRPILARLGFRRQALHAARLGFQHPVTGRQHKFESALPVDMAALIIELGGNPEGFARR
jgi:23S rRNA pseudouridine1911/1915/1917 synthase